jgi:hypothetical protein
MAKIKKDILSETIMKKVNNLDVAWYLKLEVEEFLKYLHYYKLKNILQNIDGLKDYLLVLDRQNTNQIHELEYKKSLDAYEKAHDVLYYVSKVWLTKIGEQKIHRKLRENEFNLQQIMLGVKWFLLLTANEFCNASQTRMSINRMTWQKQLKSSV